MHAAVRLALAALLALATPAALATAPVVETTAAPQEYRVRADDVATLDGIIAALYDVISGPAGQARDFDRLRSLFTPDARMGPVGARPDGSYAARIGGVADYIARSGPLLVQKGFFETEVARRTEQFGQLAHVFTTYEARFGAADGAPAMRGVNSIQLYHDGKRWWIMSVIWRAEDDKLRLPERYLHKS